MKDAGYIITLESDFSSGFGCKFRTQGCVHPHLGKYSCLCVGSLPGYWESLGVLPNPSSCADASKGQNSKRQGLG